ncbi:MAG: family 78 glycoside hydrolase catalytic domain [Victivallales bacterium]|nr:family 78 glycoside hydrolase catalytic domain [Victivallales bacterium]
MRGAVDTYRLVLAGLCCGALATAALQPVDLRCEMLRNPQGLDVPRPRLSWGFAEAVAQTRGEGQTGYQIRVATAKAALTDGAAVLWDTGRVGSKLSHLVPYAGRPLPAFAAVHWQVRVWGQAGEPSPWSEGATWSMGPATQEDWAGAQWIGLPEDVYRADRARVAVDLKGTEWIWTGEGTPREEAPGGVRFFRREFTIPAGAAQALLCMTADNELAVKLNGAPVLASKEWKIADVRDVTGKLRAGRNVLAVRAVNHPGPNSPAGLVGKLFVRMENGEERQIGTDANWQSSSAEDGGWVPAKTIGKYGCAPWRQLSTRGGTPTQTVASPLLRREFVLPAGVRRAVATVCGLGYFELRLNGLKVGNLALAPRFTTYTKRVLYQTFDVTAQVKEGPNALGLMLGNGFYNQHARAAWDMDRAPWRNMPCAILMLRLEMADGTTRTVVTDENWQAIQGPYLYDCIRNGIVYDPERLPNGWDRVGFGETGWQKAGLRPAPKGQLRADRGLPVRVTHEFAPVKIEAKGEGRWLLDGGRNIAGWVRLKVRGRAGGKVTLRYRELLRKDGSLDPRNRGHIKSGPLQTDVFRLVGGEQTLEPRFVYHGFRYVEVSGDIAPPTLADMTVRVVGTDFETAGEFSCSNELVNQIQDATLRAYRSNFVGMPTDCPHREKNGWTGDAHLAAETGLLNYAAGPAYAVWMEDMGDCQNVSGDFPGIVPTGSWGYGIGPAWDAAFFVIPFHLREYLGDDRVLTERYERMQRYLSFVGKRSPSHIVKYGLGDWCPPKGGSQGHKCPRDLTGTAYYAVFARMAADVAGLLGHAQEQGEYKNLAGTVGRAFNDAFLDREKGTYKGDTQTSLACALYQGLVPEALRARIFARLVADVEAHTRHIDCGILGTKYTLNVLTEYGRSDLAYAMATQTDFPSWGHWIAQGATTLWENWNGASSHNHVMFGDISAWFYKALAGIRPDVAHPGFRRFILRPDVVGDLREVRAWHRCPYGKIASEWQRQGTRFAWRVVVPPGTIADTFIPAVSAGVVQEAGQPVANGNGIRILGWQAGRLRLELVSGEYRFASQLREE